MGDGSEVKTVMQTLRALLQSRAAFAYRPVTLRPEGRAMKIPANAMLSTAKLDYLLTPRVKNDESKYLARAGFDRSSHIDLELAIRRLTSEQDARFDRVREHGIYYIVTGEIVGPGEIKGDLEKLKGTRFSSAMEKIRVPLFFPVPFISLYFPPVFYMGDSRLLSC